MSIENIVLGGGCFWCVEAVFLRVHGVTSVMSGYMGGVESDANYQSVCSGMTQHVEVVKVTYDSSVINTNNLLRIFFSICCNDL